MNEGSRGAMLSELVRAPFLPKPHLNPPKQFGYPTRFSEGDWPVYYSALEPRVAEAEVAHYLSANAQADATERRPIFYTLVQCEFLGKVVDLRPQRGQPGWADLTSNDHRFCQSLGREAVEMRLGGLLTPSARTKGANLPVFRSETLSNAILRGTARFAYNVATNQVDMEWITD